MNDMDRFKYHLEQCLTINPNYHHAKERYYKCFDQYYVPSTSQQRKKELTLNGHQNKPKPRLAPRNEAREFDLFWFHQADIWLNGNVFDGYYKLFIDNDLNNIISLFLMSKNKLRSIGIQNEEHIEIIMTSIDQHVIFQHDRFKEWLQSIVSNKRISNEFCQSLMNNEQPIYSFDSFGRNAPNKGKLLTILGSRYRNLVFEISNSFDTLSF